MSLEILQATGVSVVLNNNRIIKDATLRLEKGEFVGILGPNGAGKSTFLKAIRGIVPRVSGEVVLQGKKLEAYTEKEIARELAFMQQDMHVGFGFTAEEVVLTSRYPYLAWWENETKDDYRIVEECMRFAGVYDLRDKIVNQLSGGERQRVLLAKVLAQETPIIFLDEPTASLDLVYQEEIFRYCRSLTESGKTIVMICHDLAMAARFCSRLLILAQGEIRAEGKPEDVLTAQNLANTFGLHSVVYRNPISGYLDLYTYEQSVLTTQGQDISIALVCGDGDESAELLRRLYCMGVPLEVCPPRQGSVAAYRASVFGVASWDENGTLNKEEKKKLFTLFGYGIEDKAQWEWFVQMATQAKEVYCSPETVARFVLTNEDKEQYHTDRWQLVSARMALQKAYGELAICR